MILRVDFEWLTIVCFLACLMALIFIGLSLKFHNDRLRELENAVWSKK